MPKEVSCKERRDNLYQHFCRQHTNVRHGKKGESILDEIIEITYALVYDVAPEKHRGVYKRKRRLQNSHGVVFTTLYEAAVSYRMNADTLRKQVTGMVPNKTDLSFIE